MDYLNIYNELIIKRGLVNKPSGYSERHHIIPRCMGGDDSNDNLVYLTAREHFVVHLLLYKIYKLDSLAYAVQRMASRDSINSRYYDLARGLFSKNHPMKVKESVDKMVTNHHYTDPEYLARLKISHNKPELIEFRREFTTLNNPMKDPANVAKMRESLLQSANTGKTYIVVLPDNSIEYVKNLRRFCRDRGILERPLWRSRETGKPSRSGYLLITA